MDIKEKNKQFLKVTALVVCIIMILSTVTVFASTTLMTYGGKGIRSKASVSSFKPSKKSKITVFHKTVEAIIHVSYQNSFPKLIVVNR